MFEEKPLNNLKGDEFSNEKIQHKNKILKFIETFKGDGVEEVFKKPENSYWFAKILMEAFPDGYIQFDENRCVFAYKDPFYQFYDISGELNPNVYPNNCFYNWDDYYGWDACLVCKTNRDLVYKNQNLNCSHCPDEKCKRRKADCVLWRI